MTDDLAALSVRFMEAIVDRGFLTHGARSEAVPRARV